MKKMIHTTRLVAGVLAAINLSGLALAEESTGTNGNTNSGANRAGAANGGASKGGLGALLPGSEIRRNAKLTLGHRFDVLKLYPDHTVRGNWRLEYDVHFPSGGGRVLEGGVNGEWAWQNGKLCLFGYGMEHPGRQCYTLVRKGGGKQYTMTNAGTGQVWEMFFYPNEH